MRAAIIAAAALVATTMPAHGSVRGVDPAMRMLRPVALLEWRLAPAAPVARRDQRLTRRFDHFASIHSLDGQGAISPFVSDRPGAIWRGRVRGFGRMDGTGLSGIAIRARSFGLRASPSERHVSGFLASELRYGLALDGDDLLTVDLTNTSQRLPALAGIGRGKSIRVNSLYLGASLVRDRRFTFGCGWYRVITSNLAPLDAAVERAAGMPPAERGVRAALDWRIDQGVDKAPARIGVEFRDGRTDPKEGLFDAALDRDRRALLRFTTAF
jgi:hypothetical protein